METKDKAFWEALEAKIRQTKKTGGTVGEVLNTAGVKRHLYDAARARYGWAVPRGSVKKPKQAKHSFIELAPVGTGAITVKRNGIEIVLPNADMLADVLRVLEAL